MTPALDAVKPDEGLAQIARAYEDWITGGGFKTLLGTITQHFRATGVEAERVVGAVNASKPRATVEHRRAGDRARRAGPETAERGTRPRGRRWRCCVSTNGDLIERGYVPA